MELGLIPELATSARGRLISSQDDRNVLRNHPPLGLHSRVRAALPSAETGVIAGELLLEIYSSQFPLSCKDIGYITGFCGLDDHDGFSH